MSRQRNPKFRWLDALTASGLRPRSAIVAGLFIGNRWNGGDDLPYAGEDFISKETGLSVRTVRRGLSMLQSEGWLLRVRRGGNMGGRAVASTWRPMFPTGHSCLLNRPEVASQPARSDRLVDPLIDPLTVDDPWHVGADLAEVLAVPEKEKRMWANCPSYTPDYRQCPICPPGRTCAVRMAALDVKELT